MHQQVDITLAHSYFKAMNAHDTMRALPGQRKKEETETEQHVPVDLTVSTTEGEMKSEDNASVVVEHETKQQEQVKNANETLRMKRQRFGSHVTSVTKEKENESTRSLMPPPPPRPLYRPLVLHSSVPVLSTKRADSGLPPRPVLKRDTGFDETDLRSFVPLVPVTLNARMDTDRKVFNVKVESMGKRQIWLLPIKDIVSPIRVIDCEKKENTVTKTDK